MRPGQNKRMRGRNPNRKGPNPLTRSYESNGPDVKVRGTAHHVAEKYLQLARDAQSSGDPVAAESYLQHAEHYFRLIASAQQAQAQAQMGYVRPAGEYDVDEDDEDDFTAIPDRFASPPERQPAQPFNPPQPYAERPPNPPAERYAERNSHDRPERFVPDRDRSQPAERQDRPYNGYNGHERNGADRNFRNDRNGNRGPRPGRDQQPRDYQGRGEQQPVRDNGYRETPARDPQPVIAEQPSFRPSPPVERYQQPPGREARVTSEQPRHVPVTTPPPPSEPSTGLPSFITAPKPRSASVPAADAAPEPASDALFPEADPSGEAFPVRTRRRRRTRAEMEAAAEAARLAATGKAPAAE